MAAYEPRIGSEAGRGIWKSEMRQQLRVWVASVCVRIGKERKGADKRIKFHD